MIEQPCQQQLGCGIERTGGWWLPPLRPSRWVRGGSLVKVGSASLPTGSAARCACACVCSDGGRALIDQAPCPIVRARRISGDTGRALNKALHGRIRALSCKRGPGSLRDGAGVWYSENRRVAFAIPPALRWVRGSRIRLAPHRISSTMRMRMCVLRWRPHPIERTRRPTIRARRNVSCTSQSLNGTLPCAR